MTTETGPMRFPWPVMIFVAALAAAAIAGTVLPAPWLVGPFAEFLVAIGALLALGGVVMIGLAVRHLRKNRTGVMPTRAAVRFVSDGPFAISRNPIYLGMTWVLAGAGFMTGNPWFFVASALAAWLISWLAIRPEERHLEQRFGKAYRDYAKRVRRWF